MLDVAMTGATPYEAAWNMDRFSYLREHPDEAQAFDAMMANFPDNRHAAIAAAYDFSGTRLIADIGGGNGATLRHILALFRQPRGLVFDREDVVASLSTDDRMHGRIDVQSGNFFDAVPEGADAYLLIRVLHNWKDDDCLRILRACRHAMRAEAVLLLGEEILEIDPGRGQATAYLIDVQMMTMFGHARARSEGEFRALLDQSGFIMRRCHTHRVSRFNHRGYAGACRAWIASCHVTAAPPSTPTNSLASLATSRRKNRRSQKTSQRLRHTKARRWAGSDVGGLFDREESATGELAFAGLGRC